VNPTPEESPTTEDREYHEKCLEPTILRFIRSGLDLSFSRNYQHFKPAHPLTGNAGDWRETDLILFQYSTYQL